MSVKRSFVRPPLRWDDNGESFASFRLTSLTRKRIAQGIGDYRAGRRHVDDGSCCSTIDGSGRTGDSTSHHDREGETRSRQEEVSLILPSSLLHSITYHRLARITTTQHNAYSFHFDLSSSFDSLLLHFGFLFSLLAMTLLGLFRIAVRIKIDTLHPILRINLRICNTFCLLMRSIRDTNNPLRYHNELIRIDSTALDKTTRRNQRQFKI